MLSLLLALAVGQQCQVQDGRLVCSPSQRQRITVGQFYRQPQAQIASYQPVIADIDIVQRMCSMDVRGHKPGIRIHGSGTIVRTKGQVALVLTARHMNLGNARIECLDLAGTSYPAKFLGRAQDYDIAALEIQTPAEVTNWLVTNGRNASDLNEMDLSENVPRTVKIAGYGEGQHQMLAQRGSFLSGPLDATERTTASHQDLGQELYRYSMRPRQGDSGGGAWGPDGKFAGVVSAQNDERSDPVPAGLIVGPGAVRSFLKACDDTLTITPLFIKRKRTANPPQQIVVQNPPIVPPSGGLAGPVGPVGPSGPVGPTGPAVDLGPLTARVTALEGQMAQVSSVLQNLTTITSAHTAQLAKGIVFKSTGPQGTITSPAAHLGDAVDLSPYFVPSATPTPAK